MENKIRKLVTQAEPLIKWVQDKVNIPTDGPDLYNKAIYTLILIEEIKEELSKKDPNSSKKFKQSKLFK